MGARLRPDDEHVGERRVADPGLGADESIAAIDLLGPRDHAAGIGTMVGLGEAEAANRLPGRHPGQPLVLLLLRPVPPDRVHGQRALDRGRTAQPRVARFELAAGNTVGNGPGTGAAVTRQVHAEDPELAKFRHDLTRQHAGLEPVGNVRKHPVRGERPHGVADEPLLLSQLVIDLQQVRMRGACGHDRSSLVALDQSIDRLTRLPLLGLDQLEPKACPAYGEHGGRGQAHQAG